MIDKSAIDNDKFYAKTRCTLSDQLNEKSTINQSHQILKFPKLYDKKMQRLIKFHKFHNHWIWENISTILYEIFGRNIFYYEKNHF